jgi:hypothetical protein
MKEDRSRGHSGEKRLHDEGSRIAVHGLGEARGSAAMMQRMSKLVGTEYVGGFK